VAAGPEPSILLVAAVTDFCRWPLADATASERRGSFWVKAGSPVGSAAAVHDPKRTLTSSAPSLDSNESPTDFDSDSNPFPGANVA